MSEEEPGEALVPVAPVSVESGAALATVGPTVGLSITEQRDGERRLVGLRPSRPLPVFAWLGLAGAVGGIAAAVADPLLAILALRFAPFAVALGLIGLQLRYSRLQISIDPERIEVAHRPLPTRRAVVEKTLNVEGFRVGERYAGSAGDSQGRCWVIELATRDARTIELPLRLPAHQLALQAAERLNRLLREAQTPMTYRG